MGALGGGSDPAGFVGGLAEEFGGGELLNSGVGGRVGWEEGLGFGPGLSYKLRERGVGVGGEEGGREEEVAEGEGVEVEEGEGAKTKDENGTGESEKNGTKDEKQDT